MEVKALALLLCLDAAFAARILFHLPTPTYSHVSVYEPIIRAMARRGHRVVSITTQPMAEPEENVTEIDVGFVREYWKEIFDGGTAHLSNIQLIWLYEEVLSHLSDMQLSHEAVRRLKDDPDEHFDLVVVEWIKYMPTYGWAHRFGAPLVGVLSLDTFYEGHDILGNPSHPYSVPSMNNRFIADERASFAERMTGLYYAIRARLQWYLWGLEMHDRVLRKHFGHDAPSVLDLATNVSLVFLNQNHVFNRRPKVPNCIFMHMLHIREPKPLPNELRNFFDNVTRNVVYFSLGSNVKSSKLPKEKIDIFIEVFSKLPYDVLWKWEQRELPAKPSNVHLCKWCPQQDILAEDRVVLFITQGGLQSTEEAIHFRVPVLGMPLIVDQYQIVLNLKVRGAGEMIQFDTLNVGELYRTIMNMIKDPSYRSNMARLAEQIEDEPVKPLERVVWWLEYVLRHRGAEHLRAVRLPWYLHFMLDALAVALAALLAIAWIAFKLVGCYQRAAAERTKTKID